MSGNFGEAFLPTGLGRDRQRYIRKDAIVMMEVPNKTNKRGLGWEDPDLVSYVYVSEGESLERYEVATYRARELLEEWTPVVIPALPGYWGVRAHFNGDSADNEELWVEKEPVQGWFIHPEYGCLLPIVFGNENLPSMINYSVLHPDGRVVVGDANFDSLEAYVEDRRQDFLRSLQRAAERASKKKESSDAS